MLLNILKNTLAIIISIIFIGSAYFFVIKGGDMPLPLIGELPKEKEKNVVDNLTQRLSGLETIDIKTDFFSRSDFKNLTGNYKKPLPTLDGVVENPFR